MNNHHLPDILVLFPEPPIAQIVFSDSHCIADEPIDPYFRTETLGLDLLPSASDPINSQHIDSLRIDITSEDDADQAHLPGPLSQSIQLRRKEWACQIIHRLQRKAITPRSFTLCMDCDEIPLCNDTRLIDAVRSSFLGITQLNLWLQREDVTDLIPFVASFPKLEVLALICVSLYGEYEDEEPGGVGALSRMLLPQSLQTFHFSPPTILSRGNLYPDLCEWISMHSSRMERHCVKELSYLCCDEPSSDISISVLNISDHIEELYLSFQDSIADALFCTRKESEALRFQGKRPTRHRRVHYDLSHLHSLRTITFYIPALRFDTPDHYILHTLVDRIQDTLSTVSSPDLENIIILVPEYYITEVPPDLPVWYSLDAYLATVLSCPTRTKVNICATPGDEDYEVCLGDEETRSKYLQTFQQCARTGRIRFDGDFGTRLGSSGPTWNVLRQKPTA
ncbi:hypothetical protein PQX77_011199 [Marasmius sp. AFHP31]|nr:hypothetical protein PQX77_011199 [Marasmius sp. AFHP31]